jgi:trehalose 6-phosphate phosphatase
MDKHDGSRDPVSDIFAAFDLNSTALLLDVDGTLIDIALTPDDVHVPDDLCESLSRLAELTNGAVALVSGRLISTVDKLFEPLKLAAIGAHGAECRLPGGEIKKSIEPLPAEIRSELAGAASPGVIVEDKIYSVALHFREAPSEERRLRAKAEECRAAHPEQAVEVLPGKAMIEVKRAAVSKASGVRSLMKQPPFRGRKPVFIGDDVTDETVFALLPDIGGIGFSVGRKFAGLTGIFRSPADVREALTRLAANGRGRHD